MKYSVRHVTEYDYADPVSLSHHLVHLTPRADNGQVCTRRELTVTPTPAFRRDRIDPFGNRASYFSIETADKTFENAVWSYETPFPAMNGIKDYLAFYPNKVDKIEELPA